MTNATTKKKRPLDRKPIDGKNHNAWKMSGPTAPGEVPSSRSRSNNSLSNRFRLAFKKGYQNSQRSRPTKENEVDGEYEQSPTTMFDHKELAYLFNEVYKNFIIEHVKFDEIMPRVTCMRSHVHEINAIRNERGGKAAAKKFMELLAELPPEGNYQELLQALKDCGYDSIVNAIENGQIKYEQEEHKKLVFLFWDRLEHQLDPIELATELLQRNVIDFAEEQSIRLKAQHDKRLAIFHLIDDIPRKNVHWFTHFWEALYSLDKKELCRLLSPERYSEKMTVEASDPDGNNLEHNRLQHQDIVSGQQATNFKASPKYECATCLRYLHGLVKILSDQVEAMSQQLKILSDQGKANLSKLDEILSILKQHSNH